MTADTPTQPAATTPGLIPHLVCAGAADAIAFYRQAFDAEELYRLPGPDGRLVHAMLRIDGAMLMLNDEFPEMCAQGPKTLKGTSVTLHRYVPDVDAAFAKALAAGATTLMPVADQFWGDRYGVLVDPFGHQWSLATHVRNVPPAEMQQAVAAMGAP